MRLKEFKYFKCFKYNTDLDLEQYKKKIFKQTLPCVQAYTTTSVYKAKAGE